jgi:hypothetical protein
VYVKQLKLLKNKSMRNLKIYVTALLLAGCSGGDPAPTPAPPSPPTPMINTPGAVTLSAPEKNKTCEPGAVVSDTQREVSFSWTASANTDSYDMTITDLNTNAVTTVAGIAGTSTKVNLTKGTPYSWKLTSKSTKTTQTGTSDTWNFYLAGTGIGNFAPFPATIVSPLPGATVTPKAGKVTLAWTGSDPENDKLTYTVSLDAVDGKQTPAAALTNITATSAEVPVEAGKVYYWRIKSSDGSNTSTTIVYQFKI